MISIMVPDQEVFNEKTSTFSVIKGGKLLLEHSLLSIAKWEQKYHRPFLSEKYGPKTAEEVTYYIKCMTLNKDAKPDIYKNITAKNFEDVMNYIKDPYTATTFRKKPKKGPQKTLTNERIYCYMTQFSIPFTCEKWHLNQLLTLIEVCAAENTPPQKMSQKEIMAQNHAINMANRAKYHTKG